MDVAIVVSSCDHFLPTLPPFCHGFHKYWPDCPWPLRIITNFVDAPCGETVKTGDDGGPYGWSNASRRALEGMREPVILWTHDDNWISRAVDTEIIVSLIRLFEHNDLHLIRLSNCYASTICGTYAHDRRLRVIRPDSRQRCSLQPSLWRRSTLIKLLVDGESPWVFEGMAPHRSRRLSGDFLCCGGGFLPFRYISHVDPDWPEEAVRRGKWTESAVKYAQRERISVDFSVHPNGNRNTEVPY
jgi:hypothetical protein